MLSLFCLCVCVSVFYVCSQRPTSGIYLNNFPFYFGDWFGQLDQASGIHLVPLLHLTLRLQVYVPILHLSFAFFVICCKGSSTRIFQPKHKCYKFCYHFLVIIGFSSSHYFIRSENRHRMFLLKKIPSLSRIQFISFLSMVVSWIFLVYICM